MTNARKGIAMLAVFIGLSFWLGLVASLQLCFCFFVLIPYIYNNIVKDDK